jgi:hypothetical protein
VANVRYHFALDHKPTLLFFFWNGQHKGLVLLPKSKIQWWSLNLYGCVI